jgi:hypothetical protein
MDLRVASMYIDARLCRSGDLNCRCGQPRHPTAILGWRTATNMGTDMVLEALEMAASRPVQVCEKVCRSSRADKVKPSARMTLGQ